MKIRNLLSRIIPILFIVVSEIALSVFLYVKLTSKFYWIEFFIHIIGIIIVLNIIRTSRHLSSDLMWIIIIMLFPVPGTLVYLIMGANLVTGKTFISIYKEQIRASKYLKQDKNVKDELDIVDSSYKANFAFIERQGYPFYRNTGFDYFSPCEKGFKVMIDEMKKAKKYIFMEYFIIEEGEMWNTMLDVLISKSKEGVECRVMYDDLGSLNTLPASYAKKLNKLGIKAVSFNRISPIINTIMNHRDHRKILVIDGKVAFTGGCNLADEYINIKEKHGHWLDNIVRVKGEAVWSLLVIFLTNWNALRHEDNDYEKFKAKVSFTNEFDGYIAPYAQTPINKELTAQSIYEDILNHATDHVYITTPYLIIDSEMINTLIHTVKKGVDVRIILPGVADKKIIHDIGESYYHQLISAGVRVYEYVPGFVHSKVFEADDKVAVVGTINLDYRSLYLHFENAVFLYGSSKIADIKKDIENALEKSHQIELEETRVSLFKDFAIDVLRIFASLL